MTFAEKIIQKMQQLPEEKQAGVAVVDAAILERSIGQISEERLSRIGTKIVAWLLGH